MKLLVVLYISQTSMKVAFSSLLAVNMFRKMMGGDSMKIFLKEFLEALLTCVQLGITVPILFIAVFGPTALIIVAILWALDII